MKDPVEKFGRVLLRLEFSQPLNAEDWQEIAHYLRDRANKIEAGRFPETGTPVESITFYAPTVATAEQSNVAFYGYDYDISSGKYTFRTSVCVAATP